MSESKTPKNWVEVTFGDISGIKRGASPRPIADKKYFGKGRAWVRISDVTKSKKYLMKTEDYLSELGESKSVPVNPGDLIMSIAATVGRPIILKIEACIHDGFVAFSNISKSTNVEFLYYLLLKMENYFNSIGQHGTQKNINSEIVSKTKFLLPPLKEQQQIASILSNVDNLITSTQKVIDRTKSLNQGLMQKLLTKGIGHTKFKKVEWLFGKEIKIPSAWKILSLKDVSKKGLQNGVFKKPSEFGSGISLVNVFNLYSEMKIDLTNLDRVQVSDSELDKYRVYEGDIFFDRSSLVLEGIGHSNIILGMSEPTVFECHVMRLSPNKLILPKFLFYYTQTNLFKQFIMSIAKTVTMTTITQPDLEKAQIFIPPFPEQKQIASILSNVDSQIQSQTQYKEKLERLKKSLMQKLLTGEVRVIV